MSVSRALLRLLHIRQLEEEQSRIALESALAERTRLEAARAAAGARVRRGRLLVTLSARNGELPDRCAGLVETSAGIAHRAALAPRIDLAEAQVQERREQFLACRTERRQAETLLDEAEREQQERDARRLQQALDDWHGNRLHARLRSQAAQPAAPESKESAIHEPLGPSAEKVEP